MEKSQAAQKIVEAWNESEAEAKRRIQEIMDTYGSRYNLNSKSEIFKILNDPKTPEHHKEILNEFYSSYDKIQGKYAAYKKRYSLRLALRIGIVTSTILGVIMWMIPIEFFKGKESLGLALLLSSVTVVTITFLLLFLSIRADLKEINTNEDDIGKD